jgi:cytochrome c biogenesis protein CcmG/thiol:disulfide interchange protein DsbE
MAALMSSAARLLIVLSALALLSAGCTHSAATSSDPLPTISPDDFTALIDASDVPIVVNIWASWCGPCRSEAPLLREAVAAYGSRIRFIGVDVNDTQVGAASFIAQYGLDVEQYFDPRSSISTALRSTGVPHTFFFAPGGELRFAQHGIIDERTLAVQIDDLLR